MNTFSLLKFWGADHCRSTLLIRDDLNHTPQQKYDYSPQTSPLLSDLADLL